MITYTHRDEVSTESASPTLMFKFTRQFQTEVVQGLLWLGYTDPHAEQNGRHLDISAGVPAADGVRMSLDLTADFLNTPDGAAQVISKFNAEASLPTPKSKEAR